MRPLTSHRFFIYTVLLTLAGAVLRYVNINYASLWADELYSVLSVRPGNSWYEILYMQRAYQPPGYFMLLWVWTKVFAFNEYYARLLSVIGGSLAIPISAYLGKKIKGEKLGLLMAAIVALNPTQIWYSLEARFYVFVYCLAALSLLLYWHLQKERPKGILLYLLKGGIDAALCYFHHFGILFVFAQALFDVLIWRRQNDTKLFLRMMIAYVVAAFLYAPWVYWGLLQGLAIKQYWLKNTDVYQFLSFNFGYPVWLNLLALLMVTGFTIHVIRQRNFFYLLFPLICFVVTIIPVAYSFIRIPILVDRYAMVLGPVLFLMFGISLLWVLEEVKRRIPLIPAPIPFSILLLLFGFSGIAMSLVDKKPLVKQPWREMADWLKKQPDYRQAPVYSFGTLVKGESNLDFYLSEEKRARPMATLTPGADKKIYLVETSGIWQITDSLFHRVDSFYNRKRIPFKADYPGFGNIYVCERKAAAFDGAGDSTASIPKPWTAQ